MHAAKAANVDWHVQSPLLLDPGVEETGSRYDLWQLWLVNTATQEVNIKGMF